MINPKGQFMKGSIPYNKGVFGLRTGTIRVKNLNGYNFNSWKVIERTEKSRHGYWKWLCQCTCGNLKELSSNYILANKSQNCGCVRNMNSKIGRPHTEEAKKKMSMAKMGSKNNWWQGGISSWRDKIYNSPEYKNWRKNVFERDNYTCQFCGIRSFKGLGKTIFLQADHIRSFAYYPLLRFDVNNGRTLCKECHRSTPNFGKRATIQYKNNLIFN